MERVLVTGASGSLGSVVVQRLVNRGIDTVAMVKPGKGFEVPADVEVVIGDVRVRSDVDDAVRKATAVIHAAADPMRPQRVDFDGTQHVAYACAEQDAHLVYPSVVGCDDSPLRYHRAKAKIEQLIAGIPGLGWSLQRCTQFHTTVDAVLSRRGVPLPAATPLQPVDEAEAAGRLVGLVLAGPSGRVRDFGGPEVTSLERLGEQRRDRLGHAAMPLPFRGFGPLRPLNDGVLITVDGDRGVRTFWDWMNEHARHRQ